MSKKREPKTPEAAASKRKHQFGQPDANPSGCPYGAVQMREFYKWVINKATQEELEAYALDETKPAVRRSLCAQACGSAKIKDIVSLTNQVYGMPKQETDVNVQGSSVYISVEPIEE